MRAVSIRSTSALCASLLSLALPAFAPANSTQQQIDAAASKAVEYIRAQQDAASGELPGFEHGPYSSDWAATALAAAGVSAADVRGVSPGSPSLQDFLLAEYSLSPGWWTGLPNGTVDGYARVTMAAYAAGLEPARLSADSNLPAQIAGTWNPAAGSFGQPNVEAATMGILALRTTPTPAWALAPAISYLRGQQKGNGSWTYETRTAAEMTGAAVSALCVAGVPAYDPQVAAALSYLHGLQVNATGAIHSEFDNAESTSRVVNALNACGIDPQSTGWRTAAGKTPIDYLLSQQEASGPEAGGFVYEVGESPNLYTTQDVLRAIVGGVFAAPPPPRSDPSLPSVHPASSVAPGTPVPHLLAIGLAPGNVRLCKVTAPAGAALTQVLSAAKALSYPAGCVTSFSVADGLVTSLDGVAPANQDEAWLLRLDRGAESVAATQKVEFGDVIALRLGAPPSSHPEPVVLTGPAGKAGGPGASGKRGAKGKPGRNAEFSCKVERRRSGKHRVRCTVKHRHRSPRPLR